MWNLVVRSTRRNSNLGFRFLKDLPRFLILLFAWQRSTEEDWGIVRLGQPGQTITCGNGIEITIDTDRDPLYRSYGIIGRGTMVVQATSTRAGLKGLPLVVKHYFPEEIRISETDILDIVQRKAGHLPDVIGHVLHYITAKSAIIPPRIFANDWS